MKTERNGKLAYALPSKGRAAAGPKAAADSSPSPDSFVAPTTSRPASNGTGTSTANGARASTSNGVGASTNGHDRCRAREGDAARPGRSDQRARAQSPGRDEQAEHAGSSPSNHAIRDATEIRTRRKYQSCSSDSARLGLAESTVTGRQTYAWRLTVKGTRVLRKLRRRLSVVEEARRTGLRHELDGTVSTNDLPRLGRGRLMPRVNPDARRGCAPRGCLRGSSRPGR